MRERRKHARRNVSKPGKVAFWNGSCVFDCVIRDVSKGGARLSFKQQPVMLPKDMKLMIAAERRWRPVRAIWHRSNDVGVAFGR
jgi:hypothetical protein